MANLTEKNTSYIKSRSAPACELDKHSLSVKGLESMKKIKTWLSLWQQTETHLDRQQTVFVVQVI